jgi:hypothetical protein
MKPQFRYNIGPFRVVGSESGKHFTESIDGRAYLQVFPDDPRRGFGNCRGAYQGFRVGMGNGGRGLKVGGELPGIIREVGSFLLRVALHYLRQQFRVTCPGISFAGNEFS